jgi:hypothetical protein
MLNWLKAAWHDITAGLDLELYFVVVFVTGVLAYHTLGHSVAGWDPLSAEVIAACTLLALAALGIGLLHDRQERRALRDSLSELRGGRSPGDVLTTWGKHSDEFRQRLTHARTFSLLVRTPDRIVQRYQPANPINVPCRISEPEPAAPRLRRRPDAGRRLDHQTPHQLNVFAGGLELFKRAFADLHGSPHNLRQPCPLARVCVSPPSF